MRMRYPFSQELSKVINSDCYADRCDDPSIICSCQLEIRAIAALFRRERYSGQLYEKITWHSHWSRCILVVAVIAGYTKSCTLVLKCHTGLNSETCQDSNMYKLAEAKFLKRVCH